MSVSETYIAASPEKVFDVLSDPGSYGDWVVGSKDIRDADPSWPAPGTRFGHSVGFGPFTLADHTECRRSERPNMIELRAKARPLGTSIVRLDLQPEGRGTRVRMREDAGDALTAFVFNPITHLLVRGRNDESLRRLARLSVRRRGGRSGG
ncbi:MAG: SRPBCC family protein [Actinomycetota bacterium]|nr:SRPBCC family protein [Actinomycetota bacterium]